MIKSKYFCYLLRSLNPIHPNSTYIGFTTNPFRRIRQHNQEVFENLNYRSKEEQNILELLENGKCY